jgi:hypothetical protein
MSPNISSGNRALTSLNLSSNNIGGVDRTGDGEQAGKKVEVLLQSFGTGIEALEEHFEEPEDDSNAAVGSMVSAHRFEHLLSPDHLPHVFLKQIAAALEKAKIDIPADTKAKLLACFEPPGAVTALANAIKDMRALTKLVMCQNNINGAEAGKAFADMLAQNTVLKELDLSSQACGYGGKALDAAFAKDFAVGISDNGAMTSLNLASNELSVEGAKIIAAYLPKCT